jgi:TolB protein
LPPRLQQDWLYTGRAFTLLEDLLPAGWMQVLREDYGGETYWRIYLKAAAQDGSQGQPMTAQSWDFDARIQGSESDLQAGGRMMEAAPQGYWVDFTALAADYGWERVPSLSGWRNYTPGSLFNEFVYRQGLLWDEAMLELYPAEAVPTPNSP